MADRQTVAVRYVVASILLAIFLVAGALRVKATDMHRQVVTGDETTYLFAAKSLLKYHTLTRDVDGTVYRGTRPIEPTASLSPGYPVFIAAILAAGGNVFDIYCSNIALSLAAMILMLWIMVELRLGWTPILIALTLAAFYPGFVYNLNRVLTEQLFLALFLGFAGAWIRGVRTRSIAWMVTAGLLLGTATQVRAEAAAFSVVALALIAVSGERPTRVRLALGLAAGIAVIMSPWWIRNLVTLHRPLLLTDAAEGTARWGATPYYIDMQASSGTLRQVFERNMTPAPWVFARWRLFGFLQYMWSDVWDENLVHPARYLRQALLIQPLGVWIPLILSPLVVRKKVRMAVFIAIIPIAYTLTLEPIQALPRYVFPAVPFVFILIAILLTKTGESLHESEFDHRWIRNAYLAISIPFAVLLFYSLIIFPSHIAHEQSAYRLARYMGVSISQLNNPVWTKYIKLHDYRVDNTISIGGGWLQNDVDAPQILNIDVPTLRDLGQVVTKIKLKFRGGFYYDKTIIYWTDARSRSISESRVYTLPNNAWSRGTTVYIDGDVSRLMVVPYEFRWARMRIDAAVVTKYIVGKK